MPELPEVETMCRCVAPAVGCRIVGLLQPRRKLQAIQLSPPLAEFRRGVRGRRIAAVERLGKRVVLALDDGRRVVLEPRMSGLVLLADPPNRSHLRLVFRLAGGRAAELLFWDQRGLGVVSLVDEAEFARRFGPQKLGPDALTISAAELRRRLGGSRRPVKVALLDQKALVGVGNLYASEILHRAKVYPGVPCCQLRAEQWGKVHAAMRTVLRLAIRHQGSTLGDGTYRIARNRPGDFQLMHRVYQRHGAPCVQCGRAEIVRIVQAQRSTFFCPACQRRPPPARGRRQ
jgi:formamidopyrimidine-DNA glycosylase